VDVIHEVIRRLRSGEIATREDLLRVKTEVAKAAGVNVPRNSEILRALAPGEREAYRHLLVKKPTRTLSGVAVVAAMTSPHPCPHGKCIYCPGGVEFGTAQSYTGREPAALRAAQHSFDPFAQVKARIEQLETIGHPTDKIDLIIMGGTFTSRPREYQEWFVRRCFDAMNGREARTLEEAHALNEVARHRCIGLTVETRPDCFREEEIYLALRLGATRVELGIQSIYDDVLRIINRGHGVEESVRATRLAKDAGLKVCYHLMPGLPGSDPERDLRMFRTVFSDERFKPDMLKIYPTLVMEGTPLYDMWVRGEYAPLEGDALIDLMVQIKRMVPPWVRIQRIQRDIPSHLITAGNRISNLRAVVQDRMRSLGHACRCIRCREVGRRGGEDFVPMRRDYRASGGKEVFLSFEDPSVDSIAAFLRLRLPGESAHRPEMRNAAVVRELKVFGAEVPIGKRMEGAWQHRGMGRKLMVEAEEIARAEWGVDRLLVTSGVGVRGYYRKLGYERLGPYMAKEL